VKLKKKSADFLLLI